MLDRAAPHLALEQLVGLLTGNCPKDCDWPEVRRLAGWHGVLELLAVRASQCPEVPAETKAALCAIQHASAQRNLLLTAELLRISEALAAAGVQALAYKGPALAAAYYGNISQRNFGDLDLLVSPDALSHARAVLEGLGFIAWRGFAGLTPEQERAYLRSGYHFQYSRPDGSVPIELHWAVAPHSLAIDIPMEQLFRRAAPVRLGGKTVLAPSAEDLIVLLSIHGAKHMWDRLRLIADVAQILAAAQGLDFDCVLQFGSAVRARRVVLVALQLSAELFGSALPGAVATAITRDGAVERLVARVIRRLADCRSAEEERLRAHRFYFDVRERTTDKLRYLARLSFEPSLNDVRLLGSSRAAAAAGGVLRPLRVAGSLMRDSFAGVFRRS